MIDYFSTNMWQLWAVVVVLGLVLELCSGGFYIICASVGALFAAIVSPVVGLAGQLAVFAFMTAVSVFLVRPFAKKWLHRNEDKRVSNADALMGRLGVVSETIPHGGHGRVAIDGDDWKAEASSSTPDDIEKGERVKVVGRESIIITVERSAPGPA